MKTFDSEIDRILAEADETEAEVAPKYAAVVVKDKKTGKVVKKYWFDEATQSMEKRALTVPPGSTVDDVLNRIN